MARFRKTRFYLLSTLVVFLGADRVVATPLYGVSFGTSESAVLYDVDSATGAASNPRPVGAGHLVGIAWSPGGWLYGLTNSSAPANPNSLVTINPSTGASQVVGSTGLTTIIEGDLARDPTTGQLYGCYNLDTGRRQLFILNSQTGGATALPGSLSGDPSALAFSSDGTLYGIDTSLGELLTIDKISGTVLGYKTLNLALGSTAGMAIDPYTGVFYVADGESGGTDKLYTLNPATGLLTAVGPLGVADGLAGLAFVPEPGAAVLLGLGASLVVMRRRIGRRVF
jgi:DNA-binding beta-propeller fold protein YncE